MFYLKAQTNRLLWLGPLVTLFLAWPSTRGIAEEPKPPAAAEEIEFFENRIRPVLVEHCDQCHSENAKNIQGGLRLDSKTAAQKGGDSGPAVVPGNVEESLLIDALRYDGFEMPPKGKLPESVIEDFTRWIEMGAPDPRVDTEVVESTIDFDEAAKFWSFQPISASDPPSVENKSWATNPIDYFTLAKMEQLGLTPVDQASKHALIRRATFDLIGLPPTPEEIANFLEDDSPSAFETVVNRLLESEHYGERWGRYWLDVARYAEDQAHTFAVRANTNGYRYRDWVIQSFNHDLPYNEFVRLQIAGDLMEPSSEGNYDHLIALGFFGLGAQYYKNSDKAKAMADELDDRVDTLTRGFLGLTVSCARCHDHKFDPIPTQDYYSLAGIFSSSRLHNAPLCTQEEISRYNEGQNVIKQAENEVKQFYADAKVAEAETRVHQIADYMEAAWRVRIAEAAGNKEIKKQLAQENSLSEFLLSRWVNFLDPKQKGKVTALNEWHEQTANQAVEVNDASIALVQQLAQQFQDRVVRELGIRDGSIDPASSEDAPLHTPGSPRFVTPIVTKARPTAMIRADIRGTKELYLIVNDGGNGKSCDHADWISPKLIGEQGEIKLTELRWKKHEGVEPKLNSNYTGKTIRVGGKEYSDGIGVHAPSTLIFDLPEGYDRFEAVGGLDNSGTDQNGCGDQASVQFYVYTEKPANDPIINLVLGKDGPLAVPDNELEEFLQGQAKERLIALKDAVESAKKAAPPMYAIAHSYTEGNPADMKVFVRGNPARQREMAPRRFLRVLAGEERSPYTSGSGRLELANDIAHPDNPLTARVMVNRIWQHHFGRGIVGTPSNFGKLGEAPTHPALLDFLASKFMEQGWSIKQLHRDIMLSSTYRLTAESDSKNMEVDADNRYLWRANRRRLDVEAWRDTLLDVSGQLDRTMGGVSTQLNDSNNLRRTVYAKISRHQLDSLLRLFDFPDPNITSATRTETTVPQQQLFVLNSTFMINRAKAFATRIHEETTGDDSLKIERAFELAYGRSPTDAELELGLEYLSMEKAPDDKLTRWESYAQVILGSNELIYID